MICFQRYVGIKSYFPELTLNAFPLDKEYKNWVIYTAKAFVLVLIQGVLKEIRIAKMVEQNKSLSEKEIRCSKQFQKCKSHYSSQ